MKKLLIGILLISTSYSRAQTINAEQIKKDNVTIRGNALHQLRADTSFLATKYYVDSVSGGASFDTTSLSNRINLKVDSVNRHPGTDSVFYYTNGTQHFAFIDSVSSSAISAVAWSLTGNTGTSAGTNFMGTKDYQDIQFKNNDSLNVVFRRSRQIGLRGAGYDTTKFDFSASSFLPVFTANAIINRYTSVAMPVSPVDSLQPHSNTVFGLYAGDSLRYGSAVSNSFFGTAAGMNMKGLNWNALTPFTSGAYENTFIGAYAGMFADTSNGNYFGGAFAGQFSRHADNNVQIGLAAGRFNYMGINNVFIGPHCGENANNTANAAPGNNTFIGGNTGNIFEAGDRNVFIGHNSALVFTGSAGSNGNVFLGASSGINQTTGGNNTYLSYFSGTQVGNQTQAIRIGDLSGQFLIKNLSVIIGSGANCASATDDSTQTGFYCQNAATNEASTNKSNGQWGINDDTQAKGKVFTCEDANGYGHWNTNIDSAFSDNAVTINSPLGSFVMDSLNTTFTLTNSYITTASKIFYSKGTTGVLIDEVVIVPGSGSAVFTFELNGIATAPNKKVTINFEVRN